MYRLLADLRIVECASFIAAPSCALHLQQLGATVIRIDPIGGGPDFYRWPRAPGGGSFYWEGLNKGKQSVAVDFSKPEGRRLVVDLITAAGADAGLFVTNFPKDGFLAHDKLCRQRSDLITVRVMGWADGGSALDYTVNAAIGVPHMTGGAANGNEPVNHVLPAWDLMSGSYAAFSLLAAERHRRLTGLGQEVTVPLSDVALSSLAHMGQVAEVLTQGDRPRGGNDLYGAFGRDFATADGQRVMVAAITPKQWSGLIEALGVHAQVAAVEAQVGVSFARDEGQRYVHRGALMPIVEGAIAALPLAEVAQRFDAHGACWGPYRTLGQALAEEPRLSPQGPMFTPLLHPSGHRYPAPGAAAGFSQVPRLPAVRAPCLGEHTDQVLAEVLGLSTAQIGALHEAGLVAGHTA